MSVTGIGLMVSNLRSMTTFDHITPSAPPPLFPGANWSGAAASGFSTVPTDPERITAKPALRLITPPFQWFTDTLDVGVMAAANDQQSLRDNLGIAQIVFHYEGNSITVDAPSFHTIQTERGPRIYYGWWAQLRKPAAIAGHAHLYLEAVARDATMQRRVMGPYTFSPQATLHDGEILIAPSQPEITGQRYQSLTNAIAWVKASGTVNPLLTIAEAGHYNFGTTPGELYTNPGYVNVTANVPGVIIGRTVDDFNSLAPNNILNDRSKLHLFGANLTLDFRYSLALELSAANPAVAALTPHWLDGVTLITSEPLGSDADFANSGVPRSVLTSGMLLGGPWLTEVTVNGLHNAMIGAKLIRGCDAHGLGADIANSSALVLQSRFEGSDNAFWNDDRPAFSVEYTGPETTVTIARSGNVMGINGGIWTVTLGATVHTFDTGSAAFFSAAQGRFFADLVAWLNTLPGVIATLLIAPFDRVASSGSLPGLAGQGFGATSIKDAPLIVVSNLDLHGDFYQHQSGGNLENSIIAFNEVLDYDVQILFLSPPNPAPRSEKDVLIFGNVFHTPGSAGGDPVVLAGGSQWGRPNLPLPASHVVIAHNTWVNQQFLIRNEGGGLHADGYCLMKNNIIDNLSVLGGGVTNLTIDGLHLSADGAGLPTGAVNVSFGGDSATLFADQDLFDFSPMGKLLSNGRSAAIAIDLRRVAMPELAAVGAMSAAATAPPPFHPSVLFANDEQGVLFLPSPETTGVNAGDQATGLLDGSGNGNHAGATTGPTLRHDGGHYYLDFDSASMATPAFAMGSASLTIIAAVAKQSDAAGAILCEFSANTNANNGAFNLTAPENTGGGGNYGFGVKGTAIGGLVTPVALAPDASVISGVVNIAAPFRAIRRNGTQVASSAASLGSGAFGQHPLFIGKRGGATLPFKGRLYALLIVNRVLAPNELLQAEAWMAQRLP